MNSQKSVNDKILVCKMVRCFTVVNEDRASLCNHDIGFRKFIKMQYEIKKEPTLLTEPISKLKTHYKGYNQFILPLDIISIGALKTDYGWEYNDAHFVGKYYGLNMSTRSILKYLRQNRFLKDDSVGKCTVVFSDTDYNFKVINRKTDQPLYEVYYKDGGNK